MLSTYLPATKDFFTQLFGWSFQDYGPDYCAFDDGRTTGVFASENRGSVAAGLFTSKRPVVASSRSGRSRLGAAASLLIPQSRQFSAKQP